MMKIITLLPLFLLLVSCGGEVHLTNGKKTQEIAPQQTPPKVIQEKLLYQTSSGIHVVAFILQPHPYLMQLCKDVFQQFATQFTDELIVSANSVVDFRFIVHREITAGPIDQFSLASSGISRPQWSGYSAGTLNRSIAPLKNYLISGETEPISPFDTFAEISKQVLGLLATETAPIWLHLVYFRDNDISIRSTYDETYHKTSIQTFQRQLYSSPLSAFRTRVYEVAYGPSGPNRPFRAPVTNYLKVLGSVNHQFKDQFFELDNLVLAQTPTGLSSAPVIAFMQGLAQEILAGSNKAILQKTPIQSTLSVKVGGNLVPRHEYNYDSGTNEITFFNPGKIGISPGDEIEISYEVAEKKNL